MKAPLLLLATLFADSPNTTVDCLPTACEVGVEVPSFFVREVTGERPNLATCLVCRYGNRPVVLVSVRHLDVEGEKIISAIDRAVDEGRGLGLKGFAIFLANKPSDVQPRLMTLVRQKGVTMPLTIPVETDGPKALRPPADANLAVVCYAQRKVVAAHFLPPGQISKERFEQILADVGQLTQ